MTAVRTRYGRMSPLRQSRREGQDGYRTGGDDMKAIGWTRCLVCDGLYRAYAPRAWKSGDELCAWQHSFEDARHGFGRNSHCEGSYKPGRDSRLDADTFAAREIMQKRDS